MLLSKTCEYGIRTTLYLALRRDEGLIPIKSVAAALGIPYHFLAKIAQTLINGDLLISSRGPHGGVALARRPEDITLKEIVNVLDGNSIFTECVLGLPECGNRKPCPLHHSWAPARSMVERMLSEANISQLAAGVSQGDYRLAEVILDGER